MSQITATQARRQHRRCPTKADHIPEIEGIVMMEDPRTPPQVLEEFCAEWNKRELNPQLYPLHMAPVDVAEALLAAQLDYEAENAIELPEDINDSEAFLHWARSLESTEEQRKDSRNRLEFLRVIAKDAKGRLAAFEAEVSMTPNGRTLHKPHITVQTELANLSRRSTWIEPGMLDEYDRVVSGDVKRQVDHHGHERVELFRKALMAMIRDSFKLAQKTQKDAESRDSERDILQAMIDEIKTHDVPLKELAEKGCLDVGIGILEGDPHGAIEFKHGAIGATITTPATTKERTAFARLVLATIQKGDDSC